MHKSFPIAWSWQYMAALNNIWQDITVLHFKKALN